ncbi:MAG: beta-galactosidase, partial [Armatimonadota bacterium]
TAFNIHQPVKTHTVRKGIVYLQVAPWSKNTVVKLILTDPKQIGVARIPIRITDETLKVKYNPKNVMVVNQDGVEKPVIMVMAMPGMRTGFQLGPYPEKHMLTEIMEMKKLGVNLISNTAGGWWISELTGRKGVELHSASYKYWYDVLMRKAGMKGVGWSLYPPTGSGWFDNAAPLLGKKPVYSLSKSAYGGGDGVDVGDPLMPEVIAAWAKYNHARWGDYWFKTKDGRVPIEIEDSWGWMRDDINIRYVAGPLALERFRDWVKTKYGTIHKVNAAWGSGYSDFADINPEANQGVEGYGSDSGPVYNKKDNPFHDWTPATEDWDVFRTELRMDIYRKANEILRKTIPGAELALRTEGANLVIKGDPKSPDMHIRHAYYSQRRNAMVYDVIKKEDVLHFHNDYPALPYTEAEWRASMKEMVNTGVIPMYLPQFSRMRDILLEPHYGREYQMHYNLDEPSKGMMMQPLMAAYPWWKATYEEGGAPGIIWSDYLCDAFATETQKRELKLLRKYFDKMKK